MFILLSIALLKKNKNVQIIEHKLRFLLLKNVGTITMLVLSA